MTQQETLDELNAMLKKQRTKTTIIFDVTLSDLIMSTPDGFHDYVERKLKDADLLRSGEVLMIQSYTLIKADGNTLWIDVNYKVSE